MDDDELREKTKAYTQASDAYDDLLELLAGGGAPTLDDLQKARRTRNDAEKAWYQAYGLLPPD